MSRKPARKINFCFRYALTVATFEYNAIDKSGTPTTGVVEAMDRKAAIAALAEQGIFVCELTETALPGPRREKQTAATTSLPILGGVGRRYPNEKQMLAIFSQLTTALKAGLPILPALQIIQSQQTTPAGKALLDDLARAVSSGQSLSEAMEKHPAAFDRLTISMARVGETGGILEQTLDHLVKLKQRQHFVKSQLANASAYPLFVMTVGIASMIVILIWVLPKIIATIGMSPAQLPLPTRLLLGLSSFLAAWGWLCALAAVGGLWLWRQWLASGAGRLAWDTFKLRVPLLGPVLRALAVGRFARAFGALTQCGVSVLESLQVVRDTLGNAALAAQIDRAIEQVKTGKPLAEPLADAGIFPPLLVQIVAMGEQTGKLDELLLSAADSFEQSADTALNRFLALFPAILILLLAAAIFVMIAATLLPIVAMDLSVL